MAEDFVIKTKYSEHEEVIVLNEWLTTMKTLFPKDPSNATFDSVKSFILLFCLCFRIS